jgi:hypothetical protein
MIDIDRNNSQIDKIISKSSHFNPNYFLSYSQRKISNNSNNTFSNFNIRRYDGKGVPIIKGKEKKYHVIFCDQLDVPKNLIHVETIESYKNYNSKNNFDNINYVNQNFSKGRVTCCCSLL